MTMFMPDVVESASGPSTNQPMWID